MKRLGLLILLLALVGSCTATPIPLPGNEDLYGPAMDGGVQSDMLATDTAPVGQPDLDWWQPDAGSPPDAGAPPDATADGVCLECPLPDATTDGAPQPDALHDLLPPVVDQSVVQ